MNSLYFSFKANLREKTGRLFNLDLRRKLSVPAVIYYNSVSHAIYISKTDADFLFKKFSNGTKLFECNLNGENFLVIIKDIHMHPYKKEYMNIDFQKVLLDSYVSIDVFFKFIGFENSIGLKNGGVLIKHMTSILVSGKICNIPENIIVDLSFLNLNESLYLSDLKFDKNFSIPSFYTRSKFLVASIVGSRVLDDKTSKITSDKDIVLKEKTGVKEKSAVKDKAATSSKGKENIQVKKK